MPIRTATYDFGLTVVDNADVDIATSFNPNLTHWIEQGSPVAGGTALVLTPTTVPAIAQIYGDALSLSGGALTLDLTALDQGNLPDIDMTGEKIQIFKIVANVNNTAQIKVKKGAANGYNIFQSGSSEIELGAGACVLFYAPEHLPDIAAGAKTIDFSSTDVNAALQILIVSG